jgi:hypothetical protein
MELQTTNHSDIYETIVQLRGAHNYANYIIVIFVFWEIYLQVSQPIQ